MILKSITLRNIRSYREPVTIDFELGTTLFEGDVASGKSTILSAVEFALFGLGDLNGSFLLRNGMENGYVTLKFEVEGAEYLVHRGLTRKGESVRSADSFLQEGEERKKYSAKELKEKVLQLLRFNEPSNPKAQSVIYRYAIFTPQEAMRDIIERDSGTRLETLRKAYGIEQYRTAAQNTKTISTEFRVKIGDLRGRTADLDRERQELFRVRERLESLKSSLAESKKKEEAVAGELDSRRIARQEMEKRKEEMGKAQERIPLLVRQLREAEDSRSSAAKEGEGARKRVATLSKDIERLAAVESPTKSAEELDRESERLEKEITSLRDESSRLSERLDNFRNLMETGVCPTCGQEYEADQIGEKKAHIDNELGQIRGKLEALEDEKRSVNRIIDLAKDFRVAHEKLKILRDGLRESRGREESSTKLLQRMEKDLTELNEQLRQANKESEPILRMEKDIQRIGDEIQRLEREHSSIIKQLGGIEKETGGLKGDETKLEAAVKEKEGLQKLQSSLEEDRTWLSEYFAPTVELIEKQTFANRNQHFNQQFQRWFQILVDDPDLRVRVKEDFAPVIEREGYEQDYGQLSGGERTSVALAYRLALNTTVQEAALGQEPNLMILDEPTDGFSKEQLGKFGDILRELRCPQVILVSHEQELENLADRVYRVEKANGESMVSVAESHQK